jgi:hypothetical protein
MVEGITIRNSIYGPDGQIYNINSFINTVRAYEPESLIRLIGAMTNDFFKNNIKIYKGTVHLEALSVIAKTALCFEPINSLLPEERDILYLCGIYNSMDRSDIKIPNLRRLDKAGKEFLKYAIRSAYAYFGPQYTVINEISRIYYILNNLGARKSKLNVNDLESRFNKTYEISLRDYLMIMYFLHMTIVTSENNSFDVKLFDNTKDKESNINRFNKVIQYVSKPLGEYRELYETVEKYREEGYYITEYNILQDYPIVELPNTRYVAPIVSYVGRKISNKVFYDLLNIYEEELKEKYPERDPSDNEFSVLFGDLFEQYVGDLLKSVFGGNEILSYYLYGKSQSEGPDHIIISSDNVCFVEAKIVRPRIRTIVTGSLDRYEAELERLAKGVFQVLNFVNNYRSGKVGPIDLGELENYSILLVTFEPYYYYYHEDMYERFCGVIYKYCKSEFKKKGRAWHIPFNREYVRNLDLTVIAIRELEEFVGVSDESSFFDIIKNYRESFIRSKMITNIDGDGKMTIAPSFHDYLTENFPGKALENRLIKKEFDKISNEMQAYFFGPTE